MLDRQQPRARDVRCLDTACSAATRGRVFGREGDDLLKVEDSDLFSDAMAHVPRGEDHRSA